MLLPQHAPDHRFMIIAFSLPDRCMVIFISGVCSLAECLSFTNECDAYRMVEAHAHFEHEVDVRSAGFTIMGEMPTMLANWSVEFGVPSFTDSYTFHVSRHALSEWAPGFGMP